jgi:hypothetical protein
MIITGSTVVMAGRDGATGVENRLNTPNDKCQENKDD